MANPYKGHHPSRWNIATDLVPVTPSDSADLPPNLGFRVGGAGNVACETYDGGAGNPRTLTRGDGEDVWCSVRKILATGTTATGIELYSIEPPAA